MWACPNTYFTLQDVLLPNLEIFHLNNTVNVTTGGEGVSSPTSWLRALSLRVTVQTGSDVKVTSREGQNQWHWKIPDQ